MTKPPIPTENSKTKGQHTNVTKNFDYTAIADRLRTVSWSNKWWLKTFVQIQDIYTVTGKSVIFIVRVIPIDIDM